jgi:hypothetical protein
MFSRTLRNAAASLFLAALVALACATPSQALLLQPRRAAEEPVRVDREPGLLSFLLDLVECIGGALDPNGYQ